MRGGDSATNGDMTNSATSCDVANGEKVYLGADPEAFVAMSQDVIHLRGTNSTCSSNKTDAIAAITNANATHSSIFGVLYLALTLSRL